MAIFEASTKRKPGTRSNTKLVVSGGMSPAGQWVTDPNLPLLFHYDYGGPGQKEVVVSKGMLVGVSPTRYLDDHLGYKKNALTIATAAVRPFGMAPYNFTKHNDDFLDGNQPSVITREYVELPLIQNPADAAKIKWGAAYHDQAQGLILAPNDLVTWSRDPQNYGKLIKWDETKHGVGDIIGQIGEIEDDQEPFGWLKWAMWDEAARRSDQDGPVNKAGYSAPGLEGYPYDPEFTRLGRDGEGGYLSQYTTLNDAQGIPGLLDGRQKSLTVHTRDFAIPAGSQTGDTLQFALGMKNIINGTVKVFIGGTEVSNVNVDLGNGVVAYTVEDGAVQSGQAVQIQFRAEFFGTPVGWDHEGAVGVIRVLLKF